VIRLVHKYGDRLYGVQWFKQNFCKKCQTATERTGSKYCCDLNLCIRVEIARGNISERDFCSLKNEKYEDIYYDRKTISSADYPVPKCCDCKNDMEYNPEFREWFCKCK
jgi:hypothetical protein